MTDGLPNMKNTLIGVFEATEQQAKNLAAKQNPSGNVDEKAALRVFIQKWDEAVRHLIQTRNLRTDDELRTITLYDFMNWLRGQSV